MLNAVGAVLLFVWGLIAVSQLRLRPRIEREAPHTLSLRMWGLPLADLGGAGSRWAGVLVLMLTDATARPQLLWSAGATAVVLLVAAVRERGSAAAPPAEPGTARARSPYVSTDDPSGTQSNNHV